MNPELKKFGDDRMIAFIDESRLVPLDRCVGSLMVCIEDWCGAGGPLDDVSILAMEVK